MAVIFEPKNHIYTSVNPEDNIKWTSVTSVLKHFKEEFDTHKISARSANNKKSKWYGKTAKEIQAIWKAEADRASSLGDWYHNQREADILECKTIVRYDKELPIIRCMEDEHGRKVAPSQKLIEGIYPEHLVYLRSAGVCGQSDLVEVENFHVHITDYKTNKEIKQNSYVNWEGISKKMLPPLSHLEDCNYIHYCLQLSIYMYIILRHNPKLKPGKITLHHVLFEVEREDENGYPITKLSESGEPIVKEVVQYELPYMKDEVKIMLSHMKQISGLV